MNKWFSPAALALSISLASLLPCAAQAGGLQDQMDNLFNSMSNATDPGVFETQNRGAIAGGRFISKNPTMNVNFANLEIPSWKAGCGGVDLFGGSFSFINADQFVQLLRSVAANATGYAFQLALSNVFPDGAELLSELQARIQSLNQMMGNSCQLAQGVVNDSVGAMGYKMDNDVRTSATITGTMTDFFASLSESDGTSARASLKQANPDEYRKKMGNIVWKELKNNRVDLWFSTASSGSGGSGGSLDQALLEAFMSMTGTVIVGEGSDDDSNIAKTLPGNLVTLQDLIEGGTVKVYDCGSDVDNCAMDGNSPTKTVTLTGLRTKINETFLGNDSTSIGLIQKYGLGGEGVTATTQEQAVSASIGITGGLINRMAVSSPEAARSFVSDVSGAMALGMLERTARQMITASQAALATSQNSYANLAHQRLSESLRTLDSEAQSLRGQYGNLSDIVAKATANQEVVEKNRYMLEAQLTKTGGGMK
ncbi:conjugal transfer protein TraH [Pseudomonas luteola]|uniref:conjugal transfer protein TraH n=1 Tax=Pseudomonas luteola TaxID=47886 RepID=UPI000F781E99|nr:conjugal transfer protein TraH [Pseudomonas luteola]RRW40700.1 conjugal transfer protein TraH [Pseudomonas luteola]